MAKRGRKKKIAWWKKVIGYPLYGIYYVLKEFVKGIFALFGLIFKAIFKKHDKSSSSSKKDKKEDKINHKKHEELEHEIEKAKYSKGKVNTDYHYEKFKILKDIEGDFDEWEKSCYNRDSTIGIILGARGKGKSALGMKILENFKSKTSKNMYALGFKVSKLPKWITSLDNLKGIDDVEKNSVLLVDEGGITFSSRDAMSDINKLLSKVLLVARHKDLSVIFISQNSSNIDVNAIRQADYLLLKPSSLLQKDLERQIIQKIYKEADKDFKKFKSDKGLLYIYADSYRGFTSNPLPSFWNKELSKSFDKVKKD